MSMRHIISTSEVCSAREPHLRYERGCAVQVSRSSSFGTGDGGTAQKCFPINESLLLLIYQVKIISSLWQAAKIN